mmetsp:Transcript_5138/g.12206  ORF Transcript_5138/g.12206 Transcript_5138/m.12206 type:complete len:301 (+) Transcript_5138:1073-1975(+)
MFLEYVSNHLARPKPHVASLKYHATLVLRRSCQGSSLFGVLDLQPGSCHRHFLRRVRAEVDNCQCLGVVLTEAAQAQQLFGIILLPHLFSLTGRILAGDPCISLAGAAFEGVEFRFSPSSDHGTKISLERSRASLCWGLGEKVTCLRDNRDLQHGPLGQVAAGAKIQHRSLTFRGHLCISLLVVGTVRLEHDVLCAFCLGEQLYRETSQGSQWRPFLLLALFLRSKRETLTPRPPALYGHRSQIFRRLTGELDHHVLPRLKISVLSVFQVAQRWSSCLVWQLVPCRVQARTSKVDSTGVC